MAGAGLSEAEILSEILTAAERDLDRPVAGVQSFPVSLSYLLEANGADFVERAHVELLGRGTAPGEGERLERSLAEGWLGKIEILGQLRYGAEGVAHGADVPGLRRRWQLQRSYRLPVIGRILRVLSAVLLLPRALRDLQRIEQAAHADRERVARLEARLATLERGRE